MFVAYACRVPLDAQEAQHQREQAQEIEDLREAWAPQVARARAIITQIENLRHEYGAVVEDLSRRSFAGIPRAPANLNLLAAIERATHELQVLLHQPREDLNKPRQS